MAEVFFITGIGTGVGKTLVSAVFVETTGFSYWKPVQCGDLHRTDSSIVAELSPGCRILPSAVELDLPMSPHAAAKRRGVGLRLGEICRPIDEDVVIEGAGGVLVPLNTSEDIIDVAAAYAASVVVVSSYYLGSINHTLLTVAELRRRGLEILGLVFNGQANLETRDIIETRTGLPCLLEISQEAHLSPREVRRYAVKLREKLHELQPKRRGGHLAPLHPALPESGVPGHQASGGELLLPG